MSHEKPSHVTTIRSRHRLHARVMVEAARFKCSENTLWLIWSLRALNATPAEARELLTPNQYADVDRLRDLWYPLTTPVAFAAAPDPPVALTETDGTPFPLADPAAVW